MAYHIPKLKTVYGIVILFFANEVNFLPKIDRMAQKLLNLRCVFSDQYHYKIEPK